MSRTRRSQLDRFVAALHRRHLLAWVAERGGIGIAGGGAFALLLLVIALIFTRPALVAVAGSLAIGAIAGMIWGWITRPDVLRTVMEADRQLRLADLLSTAWAFRGQADEPWRQTVAHMADAACRTARPSEVLLRRWGARAWGAISLSTLLLLVLAVLVQRPSTGLAVMQNDGRLDAPAGSLLPSRPAATSSDIAPSPAMPHLPPPHRDPDAAEPATGATADAQPDTAATPPSHGSAAGGASAQAGTGSAQTRAPAQALRLQSTVGGDHPSAVARAAAGGGATSSSPSRNVNDPEPGGATSAAPQTRDATPAPAAGESAPAASGWTAVQSRPEYQPYRELIQAYFDRPQPTVLPARFGQ